MKLNPLKRFFRYACLPMLIVVMLAAACMTGCSPQENGQWISDPYIYQNTLPCTDEPEDWITMDGKVTETEWEDNTWLTFSTSGVTFEVTTEFTEAGMYIAGRAEDPFVYHHGAYVFDKNTSFELYIVRPDETEVDINNRWLYRPARFIRLRIDPMNTISYTNTPCNIVTWVDGTLNTAKETQYYETNGWGFECFITWEAMRLEDEYFAEDSIPESMKLYVSYLMIDGENENKINTTLRPISTEHWRYDTYWNFGRQGLLGDYSSALLNNSPDGPAATDQLIYSTDETGQLVVTCPVNRTQMTWAQAPSSENFSIEATFTIAADAVNGYTGLGFILYDNPVENSGYNIFAVDADSLLDSNDLQLLSCGFTDGLNWFSGFSFNEVVQENFESPYGENSVHLKLVKVGGYVYYFVDHQFYKAEYLDSLKGAVNAGLFFNCTGSVTDYIYEDYSGREEDLLETLKNYVYYVEVPGVTAYGTVTTEKAIIPQGESVTLEINPGGGYILSDITNNGVSFLDDVVGTQYTFTPTEDAKIEATYRYLDTKTEACEMVIRIQNPDGVAQSGVSYTISDDEGKLVYTGKDNGRGVIILSVPRKGTIQTDARTEEFSGNYTIVLTKNNYISEIIRVQVGDNGEYEKTVVMQPFTYGSVSLNSQTTSDVKGTFLYDTEAGKYYSGVKDSSGREVAYHTNYIGTDYYVTVELETSAATGTPNVPGIAISNGGQSIYLKVSPWDADQLFIHCGRTEGKDAQVSVSGFAHDHTSAGGTVKFSVMRKGENIYIFDAEGDLAVVLNKDGIHTVGNHAFVADNLLEGTSANVSKLFQIENQEHAVGIYNDYNAGCGETYFDIQWTQDTSVVADKIAKIVFIPVTIPENSEIESVEMSGAYDPQRGYVSGGAGYMKVKSADEKRVVSAVTIRYTDGTKSTHNARFNSLTGKSEIELTLTKQVAGISYQFAEVSVISGKITGAEADMSETELVFTETSSGAEFQAYCNSDGSYKISVFAGTYEVFAKNGDQVAYQTNISVNKDTTVDLVLKEEPYYIGSANVNGKVVESSDVVTQNVSIDSIDGTVTIPHNNKAMIAVLGNQVYTGADSFSYTIRIDGNNMPAADGTWPGGAQMGFGLTDGNNWWIFFVKKDEGNGKSVGIGVWSSGYGGGDFVYNNTISPNTITNGTAANSLSVDVVLTIEKTGQTLTLYAGEGAQRVKLLTVSSDGYVYNDPNATFNNQKQEAGQLSKISAFFDSETEFALCLGSFYYNADITFQIEVN